MLRPDVIIMNVDTPEFNGEHTIDMIKKLDPGAKIIVLIARTSSYMFQKDKVVDVFFKPYNLAEVIKKINKM